MKYDKVLHEILEKLTSVDERISALEIKMTKLESSQGMESKGKLPEQLADNVALVGLREAVTMSRPSIKCVWAILLCLGVVGTIYYIYNSTSDYLDHPTATHVELLRPTQYDYPPLILCPGTWLDTKKALSMGLTIDALEYSIAYMDNLQLHRNPSANESKNARDTFLKFYNSSNYSCLLDYFKAITVDLVAADSLATFADIPDSSFFCTRCTEAFAEKVFVGTSMCYAFTMTPADAHHYRQWSTAPQVWMKIQDKTDKAIRATNNWRAYLVPDPHLTQHNFPPIALEPLVATTLKTTAQRYITVNDADNVCNESTLILPHDSAERCIIRCLHKLFKEHFNCRLFWYSANDDFKHADRYCNYYDPVPGTNKTLDDSFASHKPLIINSAAGAACIKNCTYPCDRTVYVSTLDSKFHVNYESHDINVKARQQNMSFVAVFLDNTAISQGGILTLTEMSTFSFNTLVSNVGGTLGLFVGGTIMTLFQLIMFLVNYYLDVRDKKLTQRQQSVRQLNG